MEKALINPKEAVRAGDVFADIGGRAVLASRQLPGGRMEVVVYWKDKDGRKCGPRQGEYRNNELKCLPKLGRADYYDGFYTTPDELIDMALTFKQARVEPGADIVQISCENNTDISINNTNKQMQME